MAHDWIDVTVEEIKAPSPNALATGPFGSSISSRFFQAYGVPVIRGSNLSEDVSVRLIHKKTVFVSKEKAHEFARSVARKGDLIFTCWGTIGQVGLIDERCPYSEYIVSNKQMKLTPNPEKADSLFLYYLFSGSEMSERIKNQAIGSSVPGYNLGLLRTLKLRLPPLPEQKAIVHILGTLDDKIELNRQMNQTLEAMAQAIFKSWFVDFDPVRAKMEGRVPVGMDAATADLFPDEFEEMPVGKIPKGWEVKPLPEVVEVNPSRSLSKGRIAPYLDMKNMPTQGHRPDSWIDRPFNSGTRFKNGDTLMARITPCLENGKTAFVDFLEDGQVGWGSTEYLIFRPKPPLPVEFGYYLARSEELRTYTIQNMTGSSGRQRAPANCFWKYLMTAPSAHVANKFGDSVKPLMAKITANSNQSSTLTFIRDTLLPKLLSGEIRVKEAEKLVETMT